MGSRIKYPRTPHLPWSPGGTDDDRRLADCSHFEGKKVVITEKMDGENTTLYSFGLHARSLNSADHPSRTWVKGLHGQIAHEIPEGWRICGENLYAKHSIHYTNLPSYFLVFSIWNEENVCLSWDETVEWSHLLGLQTVPVLWEGLWSEEAVRSFWKPSEGREGYVVRLADSFPFERFPLAMAKWVRPHHVQTDDHWMHSAVIPNKLANS